MHTHNSHNDAIRVFLLSPVSGDLQGSRREKQNTFFEKQVDHDAHRQTKESQEYGASDRLYASGKENGSRS